VLHTWAKAGGKQKIENTGALTIERMRTVDEEFLDASLKFIDKAVEDDKPFFVCWNSTRMHTFTDLKEESQGKTGLGTSPTAWSSMTAMSGSCSISSASPPTPS
jgi:hypothetical protein